MATMRDKHLKLDQKKLDRAQQALGAKTKQEVIESALDLILNEAELDRLLEQLEGKGTIKKVFR
jgi:hypothetical protein